MSAMPGLVIPRFAPSCLVCLAWPVRTQSHHDVPCLRCGAANESNLEWPRKAMPRLPCPVWADQAWGSHVQRRLPSPVDPHPAMQSHVCLAPTRRSQHVRALPLLRCPVESRCVPASHSLRGLPRESSSNHSRPRLSLPRLPRRTRSSRAKESPALTALSWSDVPHHGKPSLPCHARTRRGIHSHASPGQNCLVFRVVPCATRCSRVCRSTPSPAKARLAPPDRSASSHVGHSMPFPTKSCLDKSCLPCQVRCFRSTSCPALRSLPCRVLVGPRPA